MADNKDSGYPKSNGPLYKSPIEESETYWIGNTSYRRSSSYKTLTPDDHMGIKGYQPIENSKPEFLIKDANEHHEDPRYSALEKELLESINALGIGPAGYGGATTALSLTRFPN